MKRGLTVNNKINNKVSNKVSNNLTVFEEEFGLTVDENGRIVTNSLKVADYYGKAPKSVLRKIREFTDLIPELLDRHNFVPTTYVDDCGRKQPIYLMDRQGFSMLVNKFTGDEATKFTYKYTKAFEEMAEELEHRREVSLDTVKALSEKDEKEQRKKLLKSYFGKRKTVTTFKVCSFEEFSGLVSLFDEYLGQIRNAEDKRVEYNRFIQGLTKNRNSLSTADKMYLPKITLYSHYIQEFANKKSASENKSYGQKIRYKEETIRDLDDFISRLNPKLEEYMVVNKHGFSNNYMYHNIINEKTDDTITVKTKRYKNWIDTFPNYQLDDKENLDVDWDKPIEVFLKFDCLGKFDVQNLSKSAIDQIITKVYEEDDNIVEKVMTGRNKIVDSYNEGKIYVFIRNVE